MIRSFSFHSSRFTPLVFIDEPFFSCSFCISLIEKRWSLNFYGIYLFIIIMLIVIRYILKKKSVTNIYFKSVSGKAASNLIIICAIILILCFCLFTNITTYCIRKALMINVKDSCKFHKLWDNIRLHRFSTTQVKKIPSSSNY